MESYHIRRNDGRSISFACLSDWRRVANAVMTDRSRYGHLIRESDGAVILDISTTHRQRRSAHLTRTGMLKLDRQPLYRNQ